MKINWKENINGRLTAVIIISIISFVLIILSCIFSTNMKKITYAMQTSANPAEINASYIEQRLDEIKEIQIENSTGNTEVDMTKEVTQEELKKEEEETKKKEDSSPYYIKVNYGAQTITVYKKDSKGEYSIPCRSMICSTGKATPKSGVYGTKSKNVWQGLIGNVYGQYGTQIVGNILFHSVPYLKRGDKSSLEYWAYDKLGTYASAGCVRLTVADAKWIYMNCPLGTKVEFYSSSNPGPLGKPSAKKISNAPTYIRGWDPTDPDPKNPWHTWDGVIEEEKDNKEAETNQNQTSEPNQEEPEEPIQNQEPEQKPEPIPEPEEPNKEQEKPEPKPDPEEKPDTEKPTPEPTPEEKPDEETNEELKQTPEDKKEDKKQN